MFSCLYAQNSVSMSAAYDLKMHLLRFLFFAGYDDLQSYSVVDLIFKACSSLAASFSYMYFLNNRPNVRTIKRHA